MSRDCWVALLVAAALLLAPPWPARPQPEASGRPVAELPQGRAADVARAQAIPATPSQILARPDAYDGRTVRVQGVAAAVRHKVSRKGNPYTTFQVIGPGGVPIKGFSFSHLPIGDRQPLEVIGTFKKVNPVGKYVFYNEIDASAGSVRALG